MARIRVCGVCFKPVRECDCDDHEEIAVHVEGLDSGEDDAA